MGFSRRDRPFLPGAGLSATIDRMNVVVLVVDRLHAGFLGAYGNTWIETPALDRWAADSCVFSQFLIDTPDLARLYRSYWSGLHAMCARPGADAGRPILPTLVRGGGLTTALVTDDEILSRTAMAAEFDECVLVEPCWQPELAADVFQTQTARGTMAALAWLERAKGPFLLWCHLAGLGRTWDAPASMREMYRQEGDPPPLSQADPPDRMLSADADPDEAWAAAITYAAQVTVLDQCLGAFDEFFRESRLAADTALVFTSARGFPLGEHGYIGSGNPSLYGELVQAPLMVRLPDGAGALQRRFDLVEPCDLWATLLSLAGIDRRPDSPTAIDLTPIVRGEGSASRDRLCVVGASQRAIRTPAWFLRQAAGCELYVKPDDFWEANNVAVRCPEVVECLGDALVEFDQTVQHGRMSDLPPLPRVLLEGLD